MVDQQLREKNQAQEEVEEIPELTCKIQSITDQAEVLILFSENVERIDKTFINESSLLVEVIPSESKTTD